MRKKRVVSFERAAFMPSFALFDNVKFSEVDKIVAKTVAVLLFLRYNYKGGS